MKSLVAVLALSGCTVWFGDRRQSAEVDGGSDGGSDLAADLAAADMTRISTDMAQLQWTRQTSNTTANLRGLWGCSGTDIHAVGDGVMVHLESGTWTALTSPGGAATFNAVSGNNCANVYASGLGGVLYYSAGNDVWTQQNSQTSVDLWGMWGSSTSLALLASGVGAVETSNGGGGWVVTMPSAARTTVGGVNAHIWLVGDGGEAYESTDSGASFKQRKKFGSTNLRDIWMSGDEQTVFVVGDGGAFFSSLQGKNNFSQLPTPTTENLRSVWSLDGLDVTVVGDGGTILRSLDGGNTWRPEFGATTANLWHVFGTSSTNVFAVGDSGTILHRP